MNSHTLSAIRTRRRGRAVAGRRGESGRDTVRLNDFRIRDPYVLADATSGSYFLYGTTDPDPWSGQGVGFDAYRSTNLEDWSGPIAVFRPPADFWGTTQFWAPEVHAHSGRYFMFATFAGEERSRGTQVLVAERPEGPFLPWSDGPVTPEDWESLDGTLHIDPHGRPWLVFCHEWVQIGDGSIAALRLTSDLRKAATTPVVLFHASEAPWTRPVPGTGSYVTDGPFLTRDRITGELVMLWSSLSDTGYTLGAARSSTGILGPWQHHDQPVWSQDGGHGMLFTTFDGRQMLALHQPNDSPWERATLLRPRGRGTTLSPAAPVLAET
ncbi:glycoside hydrolase family 43 protein [Microbacterium sp.]|uniref:glycoside hydrolase family 43 protein n=1 Tax=Microbacterium sp. TaxID=51671 RepID=UPI002639FCE0|nr:glycoside hydrolase family 43 protein [Microbacterium sp.]